MTLRTFWTCCLVLASLALAGCVPSVQSQSDEEKESHFLAGKSRVSTMDYKGAIESFEKALEVNPHSAAAHFELGCLYDQHDPAAAIYHYEKYLKLRPDAGNSDVVKQRVNTCKQELARNVSLGPLTERQQRELEAVTKRNKELEDEVKRLNGLLDSWKAYGAQAQAAQGSAPVVGQQRLAGQSPVVPVVVVSNPNTTRLSGASVPTTTRSHTVKPGETLAAIAKKYGVKLEALASANPRVDSRRLQVGAVLAIPNS
jgi:LysM repeat protein